MVIPKDGVQVYLVIIACIANTLHGTRVVVTAVVKLTHRFVTVKLVQNWGQPAP